MVKPYFERNDIFTMPKNEKYKFLKGTEVNLCLTATSKLQFFIGIVSTYPF